MANYDYKRLKSFNLILIRRTLIYKDYIFLDVEKNVHSGKERQFKRVLVSQKRNQGINIAGFRDDIKGGPYFWPDLISNGKMIDKVEALDLIEYYKQNRSDQKMSEEFKALVSNLSVESNPVLVVAE